MPSGANFQEHIKMRQDVAEQKSVMIEADSL